MELLLNSLILCILQTPASLVKLFMTFVRTRHTELEIACSQFDMEGSGWLGLEDLKSAFKQAGLRLTMVSIITKRKHEKV